MFVHFSLSWSAPMKSRISASFLRVLDFFGLIFVLLGSSPRQPYCLCQGSDKSNFAFARRSSLFLGLSFLVGTNTSILASAPHLLGSAISILSPPSKMLFAARISSACSHVIGKGVKRQESAISIWSPPSKMLFCSKLVNLF
jgi:hypothetical protein